MTQNSTEIKALIFDFDGLIVDTETPDFQSWQDIYRAYGASMSFAEWARWIGTMGTFDPYGYLEEQLGHPLDRAAVRAQRRARFDELMVGKSVLPGVYEYVRSAKRLGLKLGIASSSPREWIMRNLGPLELEPYFGSLSCGDDVERTKPDPAVYRLALEALGVEAQQAIALEDSPNGVWAAKGAGIYCVAVPNALTRQLSLDHADLQLDSLADLPLEDLLVQVLAGANTEGPGV